MTTESILKSEDYQNYIADLAKNAERNVKFIIAGLYLFGIAISFHYDTWMFGLGIGTLNAALFTLAVFFFPRTLFSRLVGSGVMALYVLQYIAQLHGLYEMHFWFFILPIVMIVYQDWRVYIPFGILVVIHHTTLFLLVMGGENQLLRYLVNLDQVNYMIFLYHMALAVLGILGSIWITQNLRKQTTNRFISSFQLNDQLAEMKRLALDVKKVATNISNSDDEMEVEENETSVSEALASVNEQFTTVINEFINETNEVVSRAGEEGDLSARISVDGKSGVWKELAESINNMLISVSTPIVLVNEIVNTMSRGILTKRYDVEARGDIKSLADDLNNALDSLTGLLNQIAGGIKSVEEASGTMLLSGEEMNSSTDEIAGAIAEMSHGAQRQVANIEQTSNILESILTSAKEMEEKTISINEAAKAGVDNSEKGMQMVENVVLDIENISKFSTETQESISVLNERSKEISRVLGVITEISSQTNLLALNAAIEAAQAGEYGRGFAVVAEEIRKLAEDSRKSAQEIEKLVEDVRQDTGHAVTVMNNMNSSVQSGVKSSKETAEVFNSISDGSKQSLNLSEDVLQTTKSQTKSISNVVSNVESVVVIAEQTAAGTEEITSSANELSSGMGNFNDKSKNLNDIALHLKEGMNKFVLSDDNGTTDGTLSSGQLDPGIENGALSPDPVPANGSRD